MPGNLLLLLGLLIGALPSLRDARNLSDLLVSYIFYNSDYFLSFEGASPPSLVSCICYNLDS